ncbi:MAG TPA: alpha/beta fold hydrolase, partial [Dehalococcoidia bacterium]|nr:alpha/beta fold hydrolase [Dehalococcoidia bacterium]
MSWRKGLPLSLLATAGLWAYVRWALGRLETLELSQVPRPGEVARVQGVEIHYVQEGQGHPVILLHGLGGSIYNFRSTIPAMAQSFRVVALDLPGFGLSERPRDRGYCFSDLACLVRDLLDHLGIERAHVVGHSMGGMVAARLAARFPERVDKLVLVASPIHLAPPRLLGLPLLEPVWWMVVGFAVSSRPIREMIWRNGFYDPAALTPTDMEQYLLPSRIKGYTRCLVRLLRSAAYDRPPDLSLLAQPTLILWGDGDRPITAPSVGRWLQERLPN